MHALHATGIASPNGAHIWFMLRGEKQKPAQHMFTRVVSLL